MKSFNHKPGVLQVLPSLISGGVERGTIEIANHLVANNFRSYVASAGGVMLAGVYHGGSKHFLLPLASKNPITILKNAKSLCELIVDNEIDIIHARSRAPAWSAYFAAKMAKKKFITTFHGIYNINNFLKKYYNSIMTKGEKVIAVSNFTANHIIENYEINHDKIKIIHRGVNMDYFNPENVSQERVIQIANKLHVQVDRPIIILPGRLTRWKGHKFLLESLKLLTPGSFYCLIVGDDKAHNSYRKELENIIKTSNLSKDVAIIGNVTDMAALYMLADIIISASIEPEAFGRVVAEAQAMGRSVIATNIGGACETIIDGKTGWLVEPCDAEQLASTIKHVLNVSLEERKNRANTLRQHIIDNFSENAMCSKTLELYHSLL
jgi:glycosyltransferase involved in cell wall biosynthesis